jgi:N,N-dimethyl phenylurea N-demethylase alpha subunit
LRPTLDRVDKAPADNLVPAEIFNDEDLFTAEMERIFTRNWVSVAHESEIPEPGDFVQRRIGLDPVIVTRDGDGGINLVSNFGRHRGSQVCLTDQGNSRFFTCPYHGWTYSSTGDLVGTPMMSRAYGKPLDPVARGLLRAPHIASRQGSSSRRCRRTCRASAGWMLDLIAGLHTGGMRVAGPPDRYTVRGDWKTAAENFSGDVYHVPNLHKNGKVVRTASVRRPTWAAPTSWQRAQLRPRPHHH